MQAIRVAQSGGSEVLVAAEMPDPVAGPGEAVVEIAASGVNFIDVYQRSGLYPMSLPFIPGLEGAGVVTSLGDAPEGVAVGDRVAFTSIPSAYAEQVAVPVDSLVRVPDDVELVTAGGVMLQGLTAHYLAHDTYSLEPGSTCLIHAGAGGVGLLLIQVAKRLGATVFTTVGTAEKAELARAAGADHVIIYTETDFADEVRAILGDGRLDVVYDSVGADTFDRGLELLRPRGLMALFGQSSGVVPPFELRRLIGVGSLYVTRPSLGAYLADRQELLSRSDDLFAWIAAGELRVRIGATYPLADARSAHDALEGRATTGKVVLIP
ncbi:MAG: quinone oxidoreductase family protein [Acidimicrobiia bacterium]